MTFPSFTTGDVLNASDMNAVGLWLVKTQSIGTAVSDVTVDSCFSSTYDNYRVLVRIAGASGASDVRLRMRTTTDDTAANYSWFYRGLDNAGGSLDSNGASQDYAFTGTSVSTTGIAALFEFDIMSPNLAEETRAHSMSFVRATAGMRVGGWQMLGSTQYTGFKLYSSSASTWTGGSVRVYGYRN